jgi:hypothetical protein
MRMIQIKEGKEPYYATDEWLEQYDYTSKIVLACAINKIEVPANAPQTEFVKHNWNDWNYETMSMMTRFVEFSNPQLEAAFLITNMQYVEKIVEPFAESVE